MEIKKQLITPNIAKQLLESNIRNRHIKNDLLLRYVSDMIEGRWKEDTGETIKIAKTGVVLDGQHRLWAVVKSNKNIYFHIITNMEDSVYDVLDSGAKRTSSDVFHIEGIKNSNTLSGIISSYYILKKQISKNVINRGVHYNEKPTSNQLLKYYYERESFWKSVSNQTASWYHCFAKILPPSAIGAFYAFFYDINDVDAFQFMNQLCTGQDITNNTINLLRNRLIQDKVDLKKINASLKQALILKTWNYYRKNEVAKQLKYNKVDEEFPKAI